MELAEREGFEAHATLWRSLRDEVVFWQARASARLAGFESLKVFRLSACERPPLHDFVYL